MGFEIEDGVLYRYDEEQGVTSVTIPDSVTEIGWYAFYRCCSLTSITIPDSVTSIGDEAFYGCSSLTSVTIPDSVTSIGRWAFYYCRSLTSVTIPDSVTSIGCGAFYGTAWYNAKPDGVIYAGKVAYDYKGEKSSLTKIVLKDGTKVIADSAFYNCSSLTSVTIPDSVTSIGECAFYGCSSLTSVTIPDSVTSIGDEAFYGCSSLTSVTIPDSVTSIGRWAFYYCRSLTSVTIPDSVTKIGGHAFSGRSSLKSKQANYKAFNIIDNDIMCMDYTFKPNEWTEEVTEIRLCKKGYHFCTNLFDIFNYYSGIIDKDIAIYECEVGNKVIHSKNSSKSVTNRIKPVKRLYQEDVIRILNAKEGEPSE